MNISFRQLRAFVAVARMGSFTSAAESLFLTQSALSGLIKELEQTWGIKLFERTTRRLMLTEIGQRLYPKACSILEEVDRLNLEANNYKAIYQGRVRVACSQQLASSLLPDLIAEFQQTHPTIKIDIIDCSVETVIHHVDADEADWGIGPEREARSTIMSEKLFSLPFHVVLKPEHPLASKKNLRWSDLANENLITLKGPFSDRLTEQIHSSRDKQLLDSANKVNYMSTALSMVNSGLGLTICLPYAKSQIDQYGLSMQPLTEPTINRNFYIFQRKGTELSEAAQYFKNFVMKKLNQGKFFLEKT